MLREIKEKLAIYLRNGSGWYFKEVISFEIHIVAYKPIKGSSYIPLPNVIMRKNAIINIKNEDDKCFLWSVLRYRHPKQIHGERLTDLIKYENENFQSLSPFMLILNVLQYLFTLVNQIQKKVKKIIKNPLLKVTKNMSQVVTASILKPWMEWMLISNQQFIKRKQKMKLFPKDL